MNKNLELNVQTLVNRRMDEMEDRIRKTIAREVQRLNQSKCFA